MSLLGFINLAKCIFIGNAFIKVETDRRYCDNSHNLESQHLNTLCRFSQDSHNLFTNDDSFHQNIVESTSYFPHNFYIRCLEFVATCDSIVYP